jgi:hypothetical protein
MSARPSSLRSLWPTGVLIALLAGLVPVGNLGSAATPPEFDAFVSAQHVELPRDVVVWLDGAGGAQVLWRDEVVAQIDLVLAGGRVDDPAAWSEVELSVGAGARLPHPSLIEAALVEGEAGGRRGPGAAGDDDGDGLADEDPFDGRDNDGDGRTDEDYATIGFRMRASVAELDEVGLPGLVLRPRFYQWPYFHVDNTLFWDTTLGIPEGEEVRGAPAARFRAVASLAMVDEPLPPHLSLGTAAPQRARMPYARLESEEGQRLYVGLLRLDGRDGELLPDGQGIIWEAGTDISWPLAILTAPALDVLLSDAGQALLTYGDPAAETRWKIPPICARCQRATLTSAAVDLRGDADHFQLHVDLDGLDPHVAASHEGLVIGESLPLARYLVYENELRARYRIPRESPAGRELLNAAARGTLEVETLLHSGLTLRPDAVELTVDVAILDEIERQRGAEEFEFPRHLSPDLLETWPNPFHEATTIRFRMPATLGEAFDFEETVPPSLDLSAPVPFGSDPTVRIKVYNVGGQLVRMLEESAGLVGQRSVSWDGTDEQGRPVAAGAYYVNVEVDEYTVTRRVLRLKP